MTGQAQFERALARLRRRFPSVFGGITAALPIHYRDDEATLIALLEDYISRCNWDVLDNYYAHRVNSLFEQEHGADAGVGIVDASLELRCRALLRALEDLS